MSDNYQITLTTQTGETFTGKMARRQPDLINGFVALSIENGDWMYFPPSDVKRFHFALVAETVQPEQPAAEQTEEPAEQQTAENAEKQDEANQRARFMHLSYSHQLALLNSSTTRGMIKSQAYQAMWPMSLRDDADSKAMWWNQYLRSTSRAALRTTVIFTCWRIS